MHYWIFASQLQSDKHHHTLCLHCFQCKHSQSLQSQFPVSHESTALHLFDDAHASHHCERQKILTVPLYQSIDCMGYSPAHYTMTYRYFLQVQLYASAISRNSLLGLNPLLHRLCVGKASKMGNIVIVHLQFDGTPTFFTVKFDEYATSQDGLDNTSQLTYLILRSP